MQKEKIIPRKGDLKNVILIGIDGGATKVSGWIINFSEETELFQISNQTVQKGYSEYEDFNPGYVPVDMKTQFSEMHSQIQMNREEELQGKVYMNTAADVIIELMRIFPGKKALVGIGMPGLKTDNKRGIVAINNGPRMPSYSEHIELKIKEKNLDLLSHIDHLGSDADFCGLGEEYSTEGAFRETKNAYYLGGGTGVADALKLNGVLVPFDAAKEWIAKTWEMQADEGVTLERYISAGGIQSVYSSYSNIPVEQLNKNHIYPIQILEKALDEEAAAMRTIEDVSNYITKLIFERITTMFSGWSGLFSFVNPQRKITVKNHDFTGTLLDKIVIGQRLGDLLNESKSTSILWKDIVRDLSVLIRASGNKQVTDHYLAGGMLNEDRIVFSKLREAPAIGAGVDAYLTFLSNTK